MKARFEEKDIGKGVSLELKTDAGKKEKIFGKVISLHSDGVEVEVVEMPYKGDRPIKRIPYESIEKFRYLQSTN